ncbi:MAG: PD-(D/E)XK nuclease family protein [Armatimonadetes bacterium]|nr:PD-(D/E)XK nuclease family protein [Armatimonadota bacterium]
MSTTNQDIECLTQFCINNPELEKLEDLVNRFNIFEAMGMTRQEIKHSKFLAFLLNPTEPHGLGTLFLDWFLQEATRNATHLGIKPLDFHLLDTSSAIVTTETNNIDILIVIPEHQITIIVENKVSISEHSNQLERYFSYCTSQYPDHSVFGIYLTPEGEEPSHKKYTDLSYEQVHSLLERLLTRLQGSLSQDIELSILHYKNLLERHVLNNPEIESLCNEIYRKHKHAIDLIVQNIPSSERQILNIVVDKLEGQDQWAVEYKASKYLLVTPKSWHGFLPKSDRWDYLHAITVVVDLRNEVAFLRIAIQPREQEFKKRLIDRINELDGFKNITRYDQTYTRIWSKQLLAPNLLEAEEDEKVADRFVEELNLLLNGALKSLEEAVKTAIV